MLEKRPLSAAYLSRLLPLADKAIRSLERKGLIAAEQVETERDPLRAPAARLRVEILSAPGPLTEPRPSGSGHIEGALNPPGAITPSLPPQNSTSPSAS
jgi:hypothetical protein